MVKDAPQGIKSVAHLLQKVTPLLERDLKVDLKPHMDILKQVAFQVAIPLPDCKIVRFFSV